MCTYTCVLHNYYAQSYKTTYKACTCRNCQHELDKLPTSTRIKSLSSTPWRTRASFQNSSLLGNLSNAAAYDNGVAGFNSHVLECSGL